jgi:tRNA pseudouridine38-40 synthase
MARFKLTIEYDGTPFAGWQRQDGQPTVQGALEQALARLGEEGVVVHGAGRTDTGVHALGQVAHVDLAKDWTPDRLMGAINAQVRPDPVAVLSAEVADGDFHARFSATARHYLFRLLDRRPPPVLDRNRVWWVSYPLDADVMHAAALTLVGHHDFTTFRSAQCQATSPVKTLDRLDVTRVGDEIHVRASARSFLHNQVRSLVGTLKLAGEGKWTPADVRAALDAADRAACGPVAPPQGLYLVSVDY